MILCVIGMDETAMNKPNEMTLAELNRLLKSKESQIDRLQKKRQRCLDQINEIDQQIADISGGLVGTHATGNRPRNSKSLHATVVDILKKYKKGLSLSDLADKVAGTGYKSTSKNFKNVLYQCLYNAKDISHDHQTRRYVIDH